MLQVKAISHGEHLLYQLEGTSDEGDQWQTALGIVPSPANFDLFGITRINSMGVKKWIIYFEQLKRAGVKVAFHRVPPAIVEQLNLISNFDCGATIQSVVLPFLCTSCKKLSGVVKTKEDVKQIDLDSVSIPCPHCQQSTLEFDDIAEEYLQFWK